MLRNAKLPLICLLACNAQFAFSQQNNAGDGIALHAVTADVVANTGVNKSSLTKDIAYKTNTNANNDSIKAVVARQVAYAMVTKPNNTNANTSYTSNTKPQPVYATQANFTGNNLARGTEALKNNTTGIDNTAAGYMALQNNTEGVGNTAIGVYSLQKNTTGLNNTANGSYALSNNTSGERNTAIGSLALTNNNSGSANTAIGFQSLLGFTTGSNNTAIGQNAMVFAIAGNGNTAIGAATLSKNAEGNFNTAIGINTLENNLGGSSNVGNGVRALSKNTTGNNNTAIGYESLGNNVSGNNNTVLGYRADVEADGVYNATAVGSGAKVNASNTIQLGNNAITNVNTNGSLQASGLVLNADSRLRQNIRPVDQGLSTVLQLNPVRYEKKLSTDDVAFSKSENGFIAQEIRKVLPFIVTEGKDKDRLLSVDYISLIPVLTKAIQEQQNQIQQQADDIKTLKKLVQQLLEKK